MKSLNEFLNEGKKLAIDYNSGEEDNWGKVSDILKGINSKSDAKDFIDEYANYLQSKYKGSKNYRNLIPNKIEVIWDRIDEFPEKYPLSSDIWKEVIDNKVSEIVKK